MWVGLVLLLPRVVLRSRGGVCIQCNRQVVGLGSEFPLGHNDHTRIPVRDLREQGQLSDQHLRSYMRCYRFRYS